MVAELPHRSAPNALPVGERAYRSIKQLLFASRWPAGARLDIMRLADLVHVSSTPAREALHRLAAERLVDNRAGEGFFVARPAVAELKCLYGWHGRLAAQAVDGAAGEPLDPALPYPMLAAALYGRMAAQAADAEVQHALVNAEERLRGFRRAEAEALAGAAAGLVAIGGAWAEGDSVGVRRGLARHARRLATAAAEILDRASRADIRDVGDGYSRNTSEL